MNSVLPDSWIIFFLTIFNCVFCCVYYPLFWCHNKLITLFKKGDRLDCKNYRSICITKTSAKIYDVHTMKRLSLWCSTDKCEAGTQKGRGCMEHYIVTTTVNWLYKREKLHVLFIAYSQADDRVPRMKLISNQSLKIPGMWQTNVVDCSRYTQMYRKIFLNLP